MLFLDVDYVGKMQLTSSSLCCLLQHGLWEIPAEKICYANKKMVSQSSSLSTQDVQIAQTCLKSIIVKNDSCAVKATDVNTRNCTEAKKS